MDAEYKVYNEEEAQKENQQKNVKAVSYTHLDVYKRQHIVFDNKIDGFLLELVA